MNHGTYDNTGNDHGDGDRYLRPEFFASMVDCEWDELAAFTAGPSAEPFGFTPLSPPTTVDSSSPRSDFLSLYAPQAESTQCISTAFKIVSADWVHFYVNSDVLQKVSTNDFAGTLSSAKPCEFGSPPYVYVPDTSDVLNILLHVSYGAFPSEYRPTFETLANAVRRLSAYGMSPQTYVAPHTILFEILRAQAALAPMKTYCLAGAHDLEDLAQVASSYLLSYPLSRVTDEEAAEMGPLYVKRLFLLHYDRVVRLKSLLEKPPEFHPETVSCSFKMQKALAHAWSEATYHLAKHVGPAASDILSSTLSEKLGRPKISVQCPQCVRAIETRIRKVVVDWTMTPRRI